MSIYYPTFVEALTCQRAHGKNSIDPGAWDGLVGKWSGVQGGGGDWFDLSGNDNTGTLTNGPTWKMTDKGWALDLTAASSQYIDCGSGLNGVTGARTIAAWCNVNALDVSHTIASWRVASGNRFQLMTGLVGAGSFEVHAYDGATVTKESGPSSVGWHLVVGTVDASIANPECYIDGVRQAGAGTGLNVANPDNKFLIGWARDTDHFDGKIASVMAWDRALSPSEIQHAYDRPNDLITPRPLQVAVSGAATGGPFPWYTGPNLSGNMQSLSGGI